MCLTNNRSQSQGWKHTYTNTPALICKLLKGGPEPSNFEDLCLVSVSVKYFSKLCFGTIKIQPELKYLKPILEDFTSWFQQARAWEHEFGRVPSISFIFTGSKMARICKFRYYQIVHVSWQISLTGRCRVCLSRSPGFTSDRQLCITTLFYIPVCIFSSKTNNFISRT